MAVRNGTEYVSGLADGRTVWLAGERVTDVAKHPTFAGPVDSLAGLYDLQHDRRWADVLTVEDPALGERVPRSLDPPLDHDDLHRRGRAFAVTADATFGLMGRSPDFLNAAVTAFAAAAEYVGQVDPRFADNIRRYHEQCRRTDRFLAHATINPQTDRSRSSAEQSGGTHLAVVDETPDGLVVHGAKMISTLAPVADELVVFPLPGYRPGDEQHTVAFAVPIATPGLHIVCREPFGGDRTRDSFDHPLARFDEMDATCVFDHVLVPWDRVFFRGDVELANAFYDRTTARHHTGHQGVIRGLAKAELLVGIAVELAESAGTASFLHVQEMLGEAIGLLEMSRGAVLRVEEQAWTSRWGLTTPYSPAIQALRYHFPRACSRLVEIVQIIGGGSLLATPTVDDLCSGDGPDVEHYFHAAGSASGRDRIHLLKLAWDATGDSFGQRQLQYERYHSGDPVRLAAGQYQNYDTSAMKDAVRRALRVPGQDRT